MELDVSNMWGSATALISTWGLRVVGAIAVLVIGMIVAKTIRASVRKALRRTDMDRTLIPFLSGMIYYLLVAVVLIAVLQLFGVETTSLVAVMGAAGFAIGLAMQGTLSNFSAGVMLLFFRPFSVGDFVDAAGIAGTVKQVGIFSTILATPDNVQIIASNSSIYGSTIKNFSANDNRRNDMVIGVGYGDNLGKVKTIIDGILASDDRVLKDPAPVVAVSELADSSVNFVVRPWCTKEDYWDLRFDLTKRFKEDLEAAGCNIPFPQTDVHLHQVSSS